MNQARTLVIFAAIVSGCTQAPDDSLPDDLSGGDLVSAGADMAGSDMARADLAFKSGWTQVIAASGLRFNAVWASGPDDIYAVGLNGTIFHSTGDDVWTQQKTGRMNELTSVFGSSKSDVYAVESSAVLHSTGDGRWTVVPGIPSETFSSLHRVWMASPSRVYFAGATGRSVPANMNGGTNIMQWNQTKLMPEYAAAEHSLLGLWGSDPTDLWAVGSFAQGGGTSGLVLHSAGDGSWTPQRFEPESGTLYQGTLTAVWSSSKTNVYAASGRNFIGSNSGIFRCSGPGMAWRRELGKMNPPAIYGLWGSGPADVWAVGQITDGPNYNGVVLRSAGDGQWAPDPDLPAAMLKDYPLYGIWGSRFGDVYIVGQAGIILHRRE